MSVRSDLDGRAIAVALHGIEPATFERCALIRDWLDDHGVDRVTLLVIPARDLHPVGERSPAMIDWLLERRMLGDSIAQHGFQHGRRGGEFRALDGEEARRALHAGWRLLKLAGIEPDGFVAPAYAYTPALRAALALRFRWWAGLLRVHRTHGQMHPDEHGALSPALSLAAGGRLSRVFSPQLVRIGALLPTSTLRLDIHPAYLQHPRHMLALEGVLARAGGRHRAVTYPELAGVWEPRPQPFLAAEKSAASIGLTEESPA
jgi:predicted deacetylase